MLSILVEVSLRPLLASDKPQHQLVAISLAIGVAVEVFNPISNYR